jgi:hypothetical protein
MYSVSSAIEFTRLNRSQSGIVWKNVGRSPSGVKVAWPSQPEHGNVVEFLIFI